MNAIALGPLLISLPRLYAVGCALLLLLCARFLLGLPRPAQQRWFTGLIIVWLVGARVGHILLNLDSYSDTPLEALKVWQPGYHGLWGMAAGLVWTAWTLRARLLAMGGAMAMLIAASSLWLVLVTLAPLSNEFAVDSVIRSAVSVPLGLVVALIVEPLPKPVIPVRAQVVEKSSDCSNKFVLLSSTNNPKLSPVVGS